MDNRKAEFRNKKYGNAHKAFQDTKQRRLPKKIVADQTGRMDV